MAKNKYQWLAYLQLNDYSMEEIAAIMGITMEEAEEIRKHNIGECCQIQIERQKERGEW